MKRLLGAFAMAGALSLLASAPAGAMTAVNNNTPNTVHVSHAFASVSGFLCGWSDNCNGNGVADWRVQGWFNIPGGGGMIVHGSAWGNALHDIYAEDDHGHIWDGNAPGVTPGQVFTDIPNDHSASFDRCEDGITNNNPLPPRRTLRFRNVRGTRCCGGFCPTSGTITLNL